MKKLLLASLFAFGMASVSYAASVTLEIKDATDKQGTQTKDGFQPLESFKLGDYTFSFTTTGQTKPAYWNNDNTLRMYLGTTMTITGGNIADVKTIVLKGKNLKGISATEVPTATGYTATYNATDKTITFVGSNTGSFVMNVYDKKVGNTNPNYQISSITLSTDGEGGGGEDPQPPVTLETTKVANIGAWLVSADPSELYEFENPVTVVYQNGFNTYVQDETGSMFIYGSIPAYTPGQQIPAGFVGNYKDYYSTIELVIPNDDTKDACVATYKAGVDGTMPAPAEVAISAIDGETMGNKYIKLAGVTVSALDGKNFTITQGEATIAGFNKFGVEVANTEEGKTVDVIGLVNWYTAKGATEPTASIYPIEIVAQGGTPVVPTPDENIILSADFENDACGFTFADNVFGDSKNVWQHDAGFSCMKASAYADGANAVEGAYLVSPVMDLTNRNEIVLTFKQALGHAKTIEPAEMLSLWVREENMDWSVQLPIQAWPSYEGVSGNFTKFAEAGEYDLDQFKDKKIQLGWKYTSTDATAPTWEIDAVKVTGKIDNAISDIEADVNAPVEYFNLQGVRVANPENGLYIMRQGNKVTKVIR